MGKFEITMELLTEECKLLIPLLHTLGVDASEVSSLVETIELMPEGMGKSRLMIARKARKRLHHLVKELTGHTRFSLARRALLNIAKRVEKMRSLAIDIDHHQ